MNVAVSIRQRSFARLIAFDLAEPSPISHAME
jgi:hypothetical protein